MISDQHIPKTAFGEVIGAPFTPMAGWTFAYNINTDMVRVTTSGGTVTHSGNHAVLSTGAAINQWAKIETLLPVRYITGQGARSRFTAVFTPGVAGSVQYIGVGDGADGFFFGYNDTVFGALRIRGGVFTWMPQSEWSQKLSSSMDKRIDTTTGNVFQILFQWLGYGAQEYYIEEPNDGSLELVHRAIYANANTETSILNPTLPLMAYVGNTTNNTAIVLRTPSAVGGLDGNVWGPAPRHPFTFHRSIRGSKAGVTTQANVVTIKSAATFQTKTNRVRARLTALSLATDGTKNVQITLTKGATLGGSPSYTDYNANTSTLSFDSAGTTVTGGVVVATFPLAKVEGRTIDMEPYGIEIAAGETLTTSATSAAGVDVEVNAVLAELF